MIAKRIRRGRRAPRGSVRKLYRFVDALTRYLVNAQAADLVEIETGRRLTDYILDANGAILDANGADMPEALGVELGEKVIHHDARNLIGNNLESWQAQMLAIAARPTTCRDPIEHYVLSWQAGEKPEEHDYARAVEIAVAELGLSECQAIWAVHGNTDNLHVHIAVNRIHPITGKAVSVGDGWDKDRLQQICALIEHDGGWRAEKNATYVVRDGEVVHRENGTVVRDRDGCQTRARDRASEARSVPDEFAPVVDAIAAATDWRDLHDRMHELGARYERAGPGANVVRGEARIKPSKLARDCSLPELKKRFGPFEPSPHLNGHARYKAKCNAERDKLKAAKDSAIAGVEGWYAAQSNGLAAFAGSSIVDGLVADLGARKAAILASIDVAFAGAEAAVGAFRSERSWIAAGQPEAGSAAVPAILLPSLAARAQDKAPTSDLLSKLIRSVNGSTGLIEYRDDRGAVVLVDAGGVIVVHKVQRAELEAGLLLAVARWSEVKFTGDAKAAEIVAELAQRHRIRVVDSSGRAMLPNVRGSEASPATRPEQPHVKTREPVHGEPMGALPRRPLDIEPAEVEVCQQETMESHVQSSAGDDGPDVIGYVQKRGRGSEL